MGGNSIFRNMKKKQHIWLNLVSCFLIPCYTLLFAGSIQWFSTPPPAVLPAKNQQAQQEGGHQQRTGQGGQQHVKGGVFGKRVGEVGDGDGVEVFFTISATLLVRDMWLRAQKDAP